MRNSAELHLVGGVRLMGRRVSFTKAQVRRAAKAARKDHPEAVIGVTRDGSMRDDHDSWRGKAAPKFRDSVRAIQMGSAEYLAALVACALKVATAQGKFRAAIIAFMDSADDAGLAPRTRSDMRKSFCHPGNGIDGTFGGKVGDDRIRH